MDCFSESGDHVRLSEERKPSGKIRLISSFGPVDHALQCIASDVIRATQVLRKDQYLLAGGVPAALRAVEAAHRDGYTHGRIVDAVNFYPSIQCDGLIELLKPLPRSTVQNVIGTKVSNLHPTKAGFTHSVVDCGRPPLRGQSIISQGSASSPIVGEIVMKRLLEVLPAKARSTAYADDAFIHGKTEEEVATNFELLQYAAARHPAGPLRLRSTATFKLTQPFEFLGHDGYAHDSGSICWSPSCKNLDHYMSVIENGNASVAELFDTLSKVSLRRRSYYNRANGKEWENHTNAQLWAKYAYRTNDRISLSVAVSRILDCWRLDEVCVAFEDYLPEPNGDREWDRRQKLLDCLANKSINR